jgi:hypothetical protein
MQQLAIALGFLLIGFVKASAQVPVVNITIKAEPLKREDVGRAIEIFKRACTPLNRYWTDIQTIDVEVSPEFADFRLEKGWKANIHVMIRVPDNPRLIPRSDSRIGAIAGHVLHYNLGGGRDPGMFGSKRVSQMLCGMPITDRGADTFKSIPDLGFLRYD